MHIFFAMARFFPYWALPFAFVMAELGYYFKRRKSPAQFFCWFVVGAFFISSVLWFFYRGDLHSDRWVRQFLG